MNLLKNSKHLLASFYKKQAVILCNRHLSTTQVNSRTKSGPYKDKEMNPFLYQKDRRGNIMRLKKPGGRKNIPFDKRFTISTKDVSPIKWGGSKELSQIIARDKTRFPHQPGYYDKKGKFVFVKEMVPEFVVPDLKGFDLKPYVSYRVKDITQTNFTVKDLFQATYGTEVVEKYNDGKVEDLDEFIDQFKEKQEMQN